MTSHYNDEGVLTSTPSDLILTSIGPPRADRIKAEAARAGMSPHMWIEYALDEILANLHSDAYIDGLYPHIQAPLHPTSGHGPLSDPHPGTAPKPPYDRIPPGGITHTPPVTPPGLNHWSDAAPFADPEAIVTAHLAEQDAVANEYDAAMQVKRDLETRTVCLENWADASNGEYDPHCCRFPKSCSIPYPPSQAPDPDCPCQWPIDGPDGAHIMGCPAGVWVDPEDDADADD